MVTRKRWGLLCPDDGGVLLSNPDWGERLWCPSNGHGGNGRFFDPADVQEGYEMAGAGLTAAQEKKLREGGINEVKAAAAADVAAAEAAPSPAPAKAPKDPRACECGCGENTKGGRYRPGHDAKHHARLKAEEKAKAEAAPVPGQTGIDGAEVTADGGEI